MPQTPRNSAGNYAEFLSGHKPDCNDFFVFCHNSGMTCSFSECSDHFLNLGIIQDNPAKSRNNSNYPEILCAGHLHIAPTVAPILTAAPYRNTLLKSYKIDTGAHRCAPYRSPRLLPSPSSPPHHPITLTPDTGAVSDTAISLRFCLQTHGLAHIMGIDDTGTMWRGCRLGWRSGSPERDFAGQQIRA